MTRYFWLGILFSSFLFAQTQVELSKQAKGVLVPGKGGTGLSSCPEGEGLTWQSGALVCSHTFTDLQDKGGQVFNVKAYGAVGDGVTDDIAALNSALTAADAADGAIIYFPPGTYILASTWDFSSRENITVTGTQATLKAKDASNLDWMILVSASKHIIFDGLRLDGNFINQTTGAEIVPNLVEGGRAAVLKPGSLRESSKPFTTKENRREETISHSGFREATASQPQRPHPPAQPKLPTHAALG